jgi:serine/threonine protein kinase/WD40 repeat protein
MPVDAKQVQAAFLAVVDADPAQQAAVLERECGADSELRRRVEALLIAHRDPASILERPTVAPSLIADCDPSVTQAQDRIDLGFLAPATQPGALGRIGHYEVLEVIGRGGFGIVLRALDAVLQRTVAVKVLVPELAATSPARKRFLREARAYAAVRHENVVQVYAVEEQPLPHLVMEFIPGQTLQQLLDATGPLEVPEIVRIGRQIGAGLAAAHDNGLIHRDIKPANVLIEEGPARRVKLTDFGLARAADDASLTQSGTVAGTPLYMAPEQAKGEVLDHRADLFSLGSVLYVMCTGRPPFRASGTMAILRRVCDDTPRPIREIIPEAPAWLCELIGRLHAKDPAQRLQSAAAVVDLLQRCRSDEPSVGPIPTVPPRPAHRRPRRKALFAALAAAALIGTVVLSLLNWPPPGPGTPGNEPLAGGWRPKSPPTAAELERLTTPFDGLDRTTLPQDVIARMFGTADKAPPELVAVFDGSPARLPRPGRTSWIAHDRQGRWLAVPLENEVVLLNAETLAPEKTFRAAVDRVYAVAFSPDGKRLAAACWADADGAVVWDVTTGDEKLRLPLRGLARSIQFSPDGGRLLTVGDDTTPMLWDAESGKALSPFPAHRQPVWSDAIFTGDGKYIVTHASGGEVHVWDAKTCAKIVPLAGPEPPGEQLPDARHLALAASADGKWLAAGSDSGFKVWATADWQEQPSAAIPATWLAFASDGRTLLIGQHECTDRPGHTVTRWDIKTGERKTMSLSSRGKWAVYHLSLDGKALYAMGCDPAEPALHVHDAQTGVERHLAGHVGQVRAVDVSADGTSIVSAGSDGTVRIWDLATRRLRHTITRSGKPDTEAIFAPDGKTLYAAYTEDGIIRAVDPATGQWRELGVYGSQLRRLAAAPDGTLLAAAGTNGVRLWSLPDGTPRGEVPGGPPSSGPIAFRADAATLAVAGTDSVRLIETASGRVARTLECPGAIRWVAFNPDGTSVSAAGEGAGNDVLLLDAAGAAAALRLEGHQSAVSGGAWRGDGGLLGTSGASDGTVRLWDGRRGGPAQRVIHIFEPGAQNIEAIAFSPEGRHIVTAHTDGTIAVLRLARMQTP